MSMDIKYRRAFSEVLKVLDHSTSSIKGKVPINFVKFLDQNADKTYDVTLKKDIPLKEQKLQDETKIILSMIFREYVSDDMKKEELNQYMKNIEEEKICDKTNKEIIKEKKWYQKMLEKIASIFKT